MDVIIKGLETPKMCRSCPCFRSWTEGWDYECGATGQYVGYYDERRPDWCPIAEAPEKHGRLVDADALIAAFIDAGQASERYRVGETWELNFQEILDVLAEAPTILDADGETDVEDRN